MTIQQNIEKTRVKVPARIMAGCGTKRAKDRTLMASVYRTLLFGAVTVVTAG